MVTLISCYSFFFHSARIEISIKLDGVAKELGAILTLCTNRLDYDSVSQVLERKQTVFFLKKNLQEDIANSSTTGSRIAAVAGPIAQIEVLLADVIVEPTLWRSPIPVDLTERAIGCCKTIAAELYWLDAATKGFIQDIAETRENGVLDNNALPLLLGLKLELTAALNEIGELLHFARHPTQRMGLAWRPAGVLRAQTIMAKNALRFSLLENLFILGLKSDLVSTRQVLSFSNTVFCLDKLATSVADLWETTFKISTFQRRSSIKKARTERAL
jgi:hypothetical protein